MPQPPLYLDHNATTPLAPGVFEAMRPYLEQVYYNPSSATEAARPVREAMEFARESVARLMGATQRKQIRFTSGATESIHAAFFEACTPDRQGQRILIGGAEHSATKGAAETWQARGFPVETLPVDRAGRLEVAALESALHEGPVALVALIAANNETGVVQELEGLVHRVHAAGARLHLDAVQWPGKGALDVDHWGADWASISGHKFGAPKGIGALYSRSGSAATGWLCGGGQEFGTRGGTENVASLIGLGVAAESAWERAQDPGSLAELGRLRDRLEAAVLQQIPGAYAHGAVAPRVPNTSFLCLPGPAAEFMLPLLENEGLLASAGSACDASHWQPSPGLLAMGVPQEEASSSLRLSLGPGTSGPEIDHAIEILVRCHRLLCPVA